MSNCAFCGKKSVSEIPELNRQHIIHHTEVLYTYVAACASPVLMFNLMWLPLLIHIVGTHIRQEYTRVKEY